MPCTVAPGAGAGDALTGGATETDETEDAEAERIKPRVAAMVVSRPGRMVGASSTRGTRQVCFMTVTTPNRFVPTLAGQTGDVQAEDQDQKRVNLHVEARAERRRRFHTSSDPAVDRVKDESDDRERHTRIDTGPGRSNESAVSAATPQASVARVSVTRSARPQPVGAVACEAASQHRVRDHPAGNDDNPARAVEADGLGERVAQHQLSDQPHDRTGLNRTHRASVFVVRQ